MTIDPHEKLDILKTTLAGMGKVAIAFSGGVDSAFLLKVAVETRGTGGVVAVTALSPVFPVRERREAEELVRALGVGQAVVETDELSSADFAKNDVDRCYVCKKRLMAALLEAARRNGADRLLDGANADDRGDYRPGMRAARELGVLSPLLDAGMTKADIRLLSREMDLPTWDKPSFACLASRIPYGQEITAEKLRQVELAEQYFLDRGFRNIRVRHHGDLARIEVEPGDRVRFAVPEFMDAVYQEMKNLGFTYAALDLCGYRTGSMNEGIAT